MNIQLVCDFGEKELIKFRCKDKGGNPLRINANRSIDELVAFSKSFDYFSELIFEKSQ